MLDRNTLLDLGSALAAVLLGLSVSCSDSSDNPENKARGAHEGHQQAMETADCEPVLAAMGAREHPADGSAASSGAHAHHEGHQQQGAALLPFSQRSAKSRELLEKLGEPRWGCLKHALASAESGIRDVAVVYLSREPEVGDKAIRPWATDANDEVRSGVAFVIGKTTREEFLPALASLIEDSVPEVRRSATLALRHMAVDAARIRVLAEPVLKDAEARVRAQAASTLGFARCLPSVPTLAPLLADADPGVVTAAIYSLKNLYYAKTADDALRQRIASIATKPLLSLANSSDTEVRKTAIMGLGKFRIRRAIGPLIDQLESLDPDLLPTAFTTLAELTAEKLPDEIAAWTRWWTRQSKK